MTMGVFRGSFTFSITPTRGGLGLKTGPGCFLMAIYPTGTDSGSDANEKAEDQRRERTRLHT